MKKIKVHKKTTRCIVLDEFLDRKIKELSDSMAGANQSLVIRLILNQYFNEEKDNGNQNVKD